jgi:hypothetical protein
MKDIRLQVNPTVSGWRVVCDLPIEATYFRSGARAEQAARDLAVHFSEAGHDVRVLIEDRGEQVVATQRYFAV